MTAAATAGPVHPVRARAVRRVRLRHSARVTAVLLALVVVAGLVSLCLGPAGLTPQQVAAALIGRGDTISQFVILDLRLPRLLTAGVTGATLAVSGAIFQSLARNPLASPDIIGVTAGAAAAGVTGIVVLGVSGFALAGLAGAGALVAASAIWGLAWRDGIGGTRFVLIGVGIAALGTAVVGYVLTRARDTDLQEALVWLTGSLGQAGWTSFLVLGVTAVVLLPLALARSRSLALLGLGDDVASSLGVRVGRARAGLVLLAVLLAAVAVATCGPIAFVALVSAPIARRLTRDGSPSLAASAAIGALLIVVADQVAQYAVPGTGFPVGVVTGVVGAPYLLWLLSGTARRGIDG